MLTLVQWPKQPQDSPQANVWIDHYHETVLEDYVLLKDCLPAGPLTMYVSYSGKLQRGFISQYQIKPALPLWTLSLDYATNKESLDSIINHLKKLDDEKKFEKKINIIRLPNTKPQHSASITTPHSNNIISVDISLYNKEPHKDTKDNILYIPAKNEWYLQSVFDEFTRLKNLY